MTTVTAGATGTYTLTGPQTIAIDVAANEQAQAIVIRAGVQIYGDTVRSGTVIGPFLAGDVFTLTAQRGDVDYTVASYSDPSIDAAESTALQALVSGARNPLLASGGAVNRTLKRFIDTVGVTAANSGTAATVTIDASSPFGRPAYKVAMPAGNSYAEVQLAGLGIANFDAHVIWTVWVEDYTAVTQIQAFAGTTGYGRFWQQTHNISNSNLNRVNGEHKIVVGPTAAGVANTFLAGTDSLGDTKLRIFPGAGGANVWVDVCVVPGVGRATHILTHDDASVTWMTNVLPYLSGAGLVGTFGINTGDVNGSASLYLSTAQVQAISAAGHQISPHNVTNTTVADGTGGTQTAAQYTADFVTASATLSGWIGQALDTSYHPWVQGRTMQGVMDTMRAAGLRMARGTDGGHNFPQAGLGGHVLQVKNQSLHTFTSDAQIDAICTNAARYGTTVVWMVHEVLTTGGSDGIGGDVETNVSKYAYLCNRVASDVRSGVAVNRTAAAWARELYAERLIAAALLT